MCQPIRTVCGSRSSNGVSPPIFSDPPGFAAVLATGAWVGWAATGTAAGDAAAAAAGLAAAAGEAAAGAAAGAAGAGAAGAAALGAAVGCCADGGGAQAASSRTPVPVTALRRNPRRVRLDRFKTGN